MRGAVVLAEVGRLPARPYPPQVPWLWWHGPEGALDLDLLWRAYVRRFDLEHTLRFCKQYLGWTMSLLDSPRRHLIHSSSSCSVVKPTHTSSHHPVQRAVR